MNNDLTFISLFSGIGGMDLGLERAGWSCVGQVEINPKAQAVLARHWPDVPKWSDVRDVGRHNLPPARLLCGGFPCTDVSIAGKRAGLAGKESGLWFEFHRVIDELKPDWILIENVPGLLSSNKGADFSTVLDALEDSGYITDCDILDTQNFGVPQRRRRVFIVCQSVEDLLRQRTISSGLTIAQCLIEILLCILVEARDQSIIGYSASNLPKMYSEDGRKRRMKLFGLTSEEHWVTLLENLGAVKVKFPQGLEFLDLDRGANAMDTSQTSMGDPSENIFAKMDIPSELWNTERSWKMILSDLLRVTKLYTTSTSIREITESEIYSFAQAVLSISASIILSSDSCPIYWNAASSALTAIKEYTEYARQASSQFFAGLDWIQAWDYFLGKANGTYNALVDYTSGRAAEVLFERESLPGDTAPRRRTGQGTARSAASGAGSTGESVSAVDVRNLALTDDLSGTLQAKEQGYSLNYTNPILIGTLGAEMGRNRGLGNANETDLVVVDLQQITSAVNRSQPSSVVPTMSSQHNMIVFDRQRNDEYGESSVVSTLAARDYKSATDLVRSAGQVRRLTPTECERLQSFPDGWTDGQSDSERYRQLGLAVTVNVAEWLGRRIEKAAYKAASSEESNLSHLPLTE